MKKNIIQRFLFENMDVRGELVHVDSILSSSQSIQDYPEQIRVFLGELVSIALLLSSIFKLNGILTVEARGSGDLSLLAVEVTNKKQFRSYAKWNSHAMINKRQLKDLLLKGLIVVTFDPDSGVRHQGVVSVDSDSLSANFEKYFLQSEQINTKFVVASDGIQSSGILLQQLPVDLENLVADRQESWNRVTILASTLSVDELLRLEHQELLSRLYNEDKIRLFDGFPIEYGCSCSKEKCKQVIYQLGKEEIDNILTSEKVISIGCKYCHAEYEFFKEDFIFLS